MTTRLKAWPLRLLAAAFSLSAASVLAQDGEPVPEPEYGQAADAVVPDETGAAVETIQVEPLREPEPPAAEPDVAPGKTRLETIEVTGSRLKRTDYETAQPVVVITRQDLERTGLTDISEILRNITVAGNNSLSAQQGRFALTMGETNLDLRNLGANHTLLLVNGRRWVTGLIQTQTSVSDYNTIPTAIIERVEILKDGASAIYGSDAIGGVVNVITRKDFDGLALSYHVGQFYQQGDGTNQQASISWGLNRPDTNLFLNLSYTDQAEAPNTNRAITASPSAGPTRNSIVTPNALLRFVELDSIHAAMYGCPNLQAGIAAGAVPGTLGPLRGPVAMTSMIPAGLVLCDLTLNPGATGGAGNPQDYHQINRNNPDDVYNRFADGTLKEPNERTAFFTQFNQRLFDTLSFNFEGLYNRRESISVGQNAYLGGGNLDGGPQGYLAYISATNPNNPFAQDIGWDSSCGPAGVGDPTGPSCTGIGDGSGSWAIRQGPGKNNQTFIDTVDTLRLGGGFSGDFGLAGLPVSWEGGYIYSRSKIEDILPSVNYERAGIALGNFGTCSGDCAPLNVFQGPAGLTQEAIDFIVTHNWQRNRTRQDIAYLNFSSQLPVDGWLPAPLAVALGGEFRRDQYVSDIDPTIQQGLIRLNTLNPLSGRTYAREAYVELGIPLLKDAPLAAAVDLDLAGRYSHYPRIGAVTTGKAGLRWQPIDDLLLRGTYSTGFRAPNVGELYLGAAQSYDPLSDPCANPGDNDTADQNCLMDGTPGGGSSDTVATPYDLWMGNLDLKPERSKNLTYGLIYSPTWIRDLNVSVDFYDIKITDFVVIGQGQFFLDSCYKTEQRNYCDYIHRDGTGTLTYVETPYFNLAGVETAGVDFSINYGLPLPESLGRFKLNLDASYLSKFDSIAPRPGQPDEVSNEVGKVSGQFFGFPRWKATGTLGWQFDRLKASWSTRMAYHMTEPCGDFFPTPSLKDLGLCSHPDVVDAEGNPAPENRLRTVFYHNVQIGYELSDYNANIAIGVNNVLDQDPPISRSLTSLYWYNYDPNHYETPGRFGYIRAGFKF
ncbi:TonB-dependent receptor [Fontimonas sp. SYSU GA230001]|uniref:TonB-dependent receptor domain-containing protein n=1 Tax=Fontimonas sp. SYSU GA230001 TaxID=3142450 RepID=UPI0032B36DAE